MKKYLFTFIAGIACASLHAAPGFLRSVISGSPYNGTSDIWKDTAATVVLSPDKMYTYANYNTDLSENTTYAYGAYMYMSGGTTYYFRGVMDDYTSVKVDDQFVIVQNSGCCESRGSIRFSESGWHKIDLRVSNGGGYGGNTRDTNNNWGFKGIQYSTSANSGWTDFADPGDGSRFQTTDPGCLSSYTLQYKAKFNYSVKNNKATIMKMVDVEEDVEIPASIDGFPVVAIYNSAFRDLTGITTVALNSGIEDIGANAFYGCTKLGTISGMSAVKTIGEYAFYNCTKLNNVVLPTTLTSIGQFAFNLCTTLATISVPDSVTSLGNSAFRQCSSLKTAKLPVGLTATSDALFMDCTALESVVMPTAPTKIENHTFRNCSSLVNVTISDSVTYVGAYAFCECHSLPEVTLPDRLYTIGEYAFYGCWIIPEIDIPETVMSIGSQAFAFCKAIKKFVVPQSISTMNSYLVRGCESLTDVTIPTSVTRMEQSIFEDCLSLEEIHIPETVTYMGPYMFQNCPKLKIVNIPQGITTIYNSTFALCTSLEQIEIPSGVTRIEHNAFNQCAFSEIKLPDSLEFIGYHAFYCCTRLTEVVIPQGFKEFGIRASYDTCPAFNGCSGIQRVIFMCPPPIRVADSWLFNRPWRGSREYGAQWISLSGLNNFYGYDGESILTANVISSMIRESDPTIMDVVYKIKSSKPKVKVRVLAFEDGERSFSKVVRPETFVDGTEVNVGDNVTPNVEHTISWRVSSDWTTKLAKVKFEVLACEGDLLPLELMTIPASDQYEKMKISWNAISDAQLFDALLWLTASKDSALSFSSGVLRANGTNVAQNTGFANNTQREAAASFIFGKMGYQRMTGAILNYANQETRLGLSPSGSRQYAYKMVP